MWAILVLVPPVQGIKDNVQKGPGWLNVELLVWLSYEEISNLKEVANVEEGRVNKTQFCEDDALSSNEESYFY